MKNSILLLLMLLPFGLQAQKLVEERWPLAAGKAVKLNLDHAQDIQLKGWDKPEVLVKAIVQINGGEHNDAYSLTAKQEGGLNIQSQLNEKEIGSTSYSDCAGDQSNIQISRGMVQRIICLEIRYEVWVPRNAAVSLKTISGNVTATNLNGALNLHSISGFIDVSLPQALAADLWLKSVTGELYTDLDMNILNAKDEIPIVGYEMQARLGKGGTPVRLETISSNIYLRKQ